MAYRVATRVGETEEAARTSSTSEGAAESVQLQLGRLEKEGEFFFNDLSKAWLN